MVKNFAKLVWKGFIYPELSKRVKATPNTLDDNALAFVDTNITAIIDMLPF